RASRRCCRAGDSRGTRLDPRPPGTRASRARRRGRGSPRLRARPHRRSRLPSRPDGSGPRTRRAGSTRRSDHAHRSRPRAPPPPARAAEPVPSPALYGTLGDLHDAAGDPAEAERHWDLVPVMERLAAARGATYGREVALFLADHDREPAEALRLARIEAGRRDDVYTDDVLAWALAKNDRPVQAMRAAHRALRLGTEDAAFHYHAGMIAQALGRSRSAARHLGRALALDPAFDVRQGPIARAALDALEGQRLARADHRDVR